MLRMTQKRQKTLSPTCLAFAGEAWECGGEGFRQKKDLTLAGLALTFTLLCGNSAVAQIAPDATLGAESSAVTPIDGQIDRIDGGAIRGANLFHSFREFNIGVGRGVYFSNPAQIQNILTRITGTNASNIFGTLGVLGNANLFLINPNGIIFGPNAQLDLRGSFLASTASSIKFPNSTEYSATNPQAPPLLTINVPVGLQFGANSGKIVNQATATDSNGLLVGLQVQQGKSLVLAGGDVTLTGGGLSAVGGRIELGGLAGAGAVGLTAEGNTFRLSFPENIPLANVTLSNDARVTVRGEGGGDIAVSANTFTATGGGRLVAGTSGAGNGGDITVNANTISISGRGATVGSGILSQALPGSSGNLGDIRINAKNISLSGNQVTFNLAEDLGQETGVQNVALQNASGKAGNIFISTESLSASSVAVVRSFTAGSGNAGDVAISAKDINLSSLGSGIESGTRGQGNAGNVTINTETLTERDGAGVGATTLGAGRGGIVTVNASESVELIGISSDRTTPSSLITSSYSGTGAAGDVRIVTRRLAVRDGAVVGADTSGEGAAGNITVTASDSVELTGSSSANFLPGQLVEMTGGLSALTSGSGKAGNITITAGKLTVRDGSQISAGTVGSGDAGSVSVSASDVELIGTAADGRLSSALTTLVNEGATGKGGNVTVKTQRLTVRDGAQISAGTYGIGNAGSVSVSASDVELIGTSANNKSPTPSGLNAFVGEKAIGNGGTVTVDTQRLTVRDGAQISAGTYGFGDAGSVSVRASDVELIGTAANGLFSSNLNSLVGEKATGNGGTVTVDTQRLTVRDGAEISSATLGFGNAGSVSVHASDVELIGTAAKSVLSNGLNARVGEKATGNGGTVTVNTQQLTVRDGAQISSGTFGSGNAGSVSVRASDVQLIGTTANGLFPSSLSAEVSKNATGNGGTVTVDTDRLTVQERATITVSSLGLGDPGNLKVTAGNILLNTQGSLTATSETGKGGNINLEAQNIQLRHASQISAAGSKTGNITLEGNIPIKAETLVLLEASRIFTSASDPQGGSNITISPLSKLNLAVFKSPDSTINAAGKLTIEGDVNVSPPQVPPVEVVDSTRLIDRRCTPEKLKGNEFTITGKGGIPRAPSDALASDALAVNWISLPEDTPAGGSAGVSGAQERGSSEKIPKSPNPGSLVEAQGWVIGSNGEVILTASPNTGIPHAPALAPPPGCR
jgi:filamentous hemagglutinin family protein